MIGQLLLGGGAKSLLHQQPIFRPFPWVLLQSILGNVGNHQLRESGFTKNALWLNIKGWILPEFFISQQNTTFAWIALRPCIAFFFFFSYFHLHEVHNSLNDQVNETYPPHPWKTLRKQYGDERQEARRPAVVDVVRAPVAWNPSLLNTVTFDPLSLCPLCLLIGASRWALWTEKKNYVSFPLSGVVVNIRLLVSLASSEGVRLDPPCAKKKTRKERKRF